MSRYVQCSNISVIMVKRTRNYLNNPISDSTSSSCHIGPHAWGRVWQTRRFRKYQFFNYNRLNYPLIAFVKWSWQHFWSFVPTDIRIYWWKSNLNTLRKKCNIWPYSPLHSTESLTDSLYKHWIHYILQFFFDKSRVTYWLKKNIFVYFSYKWTVFQLKN